MKAQMKPAIAAIALIGFAACPANQNSPSSIIKRNTAKLSIWKCRPI